MALDRLQNDDTRPMPDPELIDQLLAPPAPEKLSRTTMILLLTAASMLAFFVPLCLLTTAVNEDVKNMNTDLGFVRTSLTQVPTPIPAIQKLMTPIAQTQGQINQFNAVYPTIAAPRADWQSIMAAINNYNPNQMTLTAISRTANSLVITGNAADDNFVTTYAHGLEQSAIFSRVVLQSLHSLAVTATVQIAKTSTVVQMSTPIVMPSATNIPVQKYVFPTTVPINSSAAAPSQPTPTPDLRDELEPDESQSKPIAIKQPQSHSFYPEGDVDAVYFLAKMGRYYHIYTTNLAPGVDTNLSVRSGALVFTNDDATPGSLYSEIFFQNSGPDTNAMVVISNRGVFGPDKTFSIIVEEYLPTPTPANTSTPLPTATSTRLPTLTPRPSPTATPDARDMFEPDDADPFSKPISIGETQSHNFFPVGDIDRLYFPVKKDRYFQVLTSGLALGVDTMVTVTLGNYPAWTDDDYAPGIGNYASAVCFQAPQDGTAVATVVNNARQYGATKTYQVKVSEIPNLTSSPCPQPTPTPKAAAVSRNTVKVPGRAKILWMGDGSSEGTNGQSVYIPAIQFIIIADLKVKAP